MKKKGTKRIKRSEIIRVTKTAAFEMAHALANYDGPCRNIHGHSYKLAITVTGTVIKEKGDPKEGMVIDFKDIKMIMNEVVQRYDHALVLSNETQSATKTKLSSQFDKVLFVDYQPTCENLLIDIKNRLNEKLDNSYKLFSVRLDETATSYAEWYVTDNN